MSANSPGSAKLRMGLTLLEVVVTIVILGIIAVPITLNFSASTRGSGESARLDEAAFKLAKIADAAGRFSGVQGTNSFTQTMFPGGGTNPGRLSHLTTKLVAGDLNACGGAYATITLWKGPFYNHVIPKSGFKIVDGFFADDTLSRYDSVGNVTKVPATGGTSNTTSWGTLAIVMQNVTRTDADGLRTRIEGSSGVTVGTVRYATTGDPVTVYYHFNIHGC